MLRKINCLAPSDIKIYSKSTYHSFFCNEYEALQDYMAPDHGDLGFAMGYLS
jgi:hypothetical protein